MQRGTLLADGTRACALFETSLPVRRYLPREDAHAELRPSDLRTTCAYKGVAPYFHVQRLENVAWTYPDPRHDALPVRDLVCFFDEQVDVELDGELQERPPTPWGAPGWWRIPVPR